MITIVLRAINDSEFDPDLHAVAWFSLLGLTLTVAVLWLTGPAAAEALGMM